jgi:hypothetical protein
MSQVIFRLIEQTVTQPGSNECTNDKCVQQRIQQGGRYTFTPEKVFEIKIAYGKGNNEAKAVIPDFYGPDREDNGVNIPIDG